MKTYSFAILWSLIDLGEISNPLQHQRDRTCPREPAVAAVPASGSGPAVDAVIETYNRARRSVDLELLQRSQREGARDAVAELRRHVGAVYDLLGSPALRGLLSEHDEGLVRQRLAAAEAKLAVLSA